LLAARNGDRRGRAVWILGGAVSWQARVAEKRPAVTLAAPAHRPPPERPGRGGMAALLRFRSHTGPAPMRTALYQLAEDFLSTIVFLIAYLSTGNLYLAVVLAIVVGIGQFVLLKRRGRTPDVMGWLSLGLAMALGAATLITSDSRFIMAKPSVIHFAIGVVMLRRGWMARYMPEIVKQNVPERVLIGFGYAWAALMFVLGTLNLYVAARYSVEVWAWFISVVAVGAKVAAFLIQYGALQIMIRRNMRLAAAKSAATPLSP
jgi:intracellular septation protein A